MKSFFSFFCFVYLLISCNTLSLSNDEAQKLINSTLSLPKAYSMDVSLGDWGSPYRNGFYLHTLLEEGFLYDNQGTTHDANGWLVNTRQLDVTEMGKPFFLGSNKKNNSDVLYFKMYDVDFGEIKGVLINKEQQTATVRFTLVAKNIAPYTMKAERRFGFESQKETELIFKKFDNGWQPESQDKNLLEKIWKGFN